MALHVSLSVNDEPIGFIYIQRTAPLHVSGPDEVCTYKWEVGKDYEGRSQRGTGLQHRYGDGALSLIAEVIEVAESEWKGEGVDG